MKIDRLIGIIAVLQQKKQVTMPELAARFEVSRRTISRDIEAICQAGIPIVTVQGNHGGVSLMEGFALDTTVFTRDELSAVLTGLQSLDSVSRTPMAGKLLSKLGNEQMEIQEHVVIDLASFYKEDLAEKIERFRGAVGARKKVTFCYCSPRGEGIREIDPYQVVFKWSDWYVYGYCPSHGAFRLYKLRRMWDLKVKEENYAVQPLPREEQRFGTFMTDDYIIRVLCDPKVKYRLVEEYGPGSVTEIDDGKLLFERGFTYAQDAVNWVLSFGEQMQVLSPLELVEKVKETLRNMQRLYET